MKILEGEIFHKIEALKTVFKLLKFQKLKIFTNRQNKVILMKSFITWKGNLASKQEISRWNGKRLRTLPANSTKFNLTIQPYSTSIQLQINLQKWTCVYLLLIYSSPMTTTCACRRHFLLKECLPQLTKTTC